MVRIPVIRNRRRFSRRTVHSAVLVSLNGGSGLLYNLSESGLALDVMGSPPPSDLILLAFELPGAGGPIEASAQLAWKEEPGRRAGLRFAKLPETTQRRIKEWLSSRAVGLDEQEANRAQPETLAPGPVEAVAPAPEASGAIPQGNEAAFQELLADSAPSTPAQVQPEAHRSQGFASWEVDGWRREDATPQVSEAAFQEPAADSVTSTPAQVQSEAHRSQSFASWEVDGWKRDDATPQENEAAFQEPPADSAASTPAQAEP
ncbi:MAG TPA: PilZ domain-containing protein, partial [Candidatus Acidoferrales bacterium]|nr:PilZ domain-containing protein [Candidatus Acidoferrales bacterium]